MHALAYVIVDDRFCDSEVSQIMSDFDCNVEVEPHTVDCCCKHYGETKKDCEDCNGSGFVVTTENPNARFDWYQIGGRWTGVLVPDYDPSCDPVNMEECDKCKGVSGKNCTMCGGKGYRVMWPSKWSGFPGDVCPIAALGDNIMLPNDMVVDGDWISRGDFTDEEWKEKFSSIKKEHTSGFLVVVDYHT